MASKKLDIILAAKDKMSATLTRASAGLSRFSDKIQTLNKKMKASQLNAMGQSMVKAGQKISSVGRTMTAAFTLPVVGGLTYAIKTFADFEEQLLSVQETTDISGEALKKLGLDIMKMGKTMPITTEEMLKITAAAGQMGIKTPDALLKVTEVVAKFARVADMSGDQAISTLSKILKLSNEPIDDIEKLSSSIVALGDNFAANEGKITDGAFGLSKMIASRFNISSKSILALSGTMSGLGIDARSGSMAVMKSLDKIDAIIKEGKGDGLKELMRITGMSLNDLKQGFQKDSFSIFKQFIAGLSSAKIRGEDFNKSLEKIGVKGGKVATELSKLTSGYWELVKGVDIVNSQYANATALNEEFAIKADSLKGKIEKLRNKFDFFAKTLAVKLMPTIEKKVIPALERMFDWFDKNPELTETIMKFVGLAAVLGPVVIGIGAIVSSFGYMAIGLSAITLPMIKFAALAALLITVGVAIYQNWKPIKEFFLKFWDGPFARWMTGRTLLDWFISAAGYLKSAWGPTKDFLTKMWNSPIGKLLRFSASLNPLIALANLMMSAWRPISDLLVGMWDKAKTAMWSFFESAKAKAGEIADSFLFGGGYKFFSAPTATQSTGPQASISTPKLGADRQFAVNNVQKSVQTNNAKVVVDFKNLPKGTSVLPMKNEGALDLNLGYSNS